MMSDSRGAFGDKVKNDTSEEGVDGWLSRVGVGAMKVAADGWLSRVGVGEGSCISWDGGGEYC